MLHLDLQCQQAPPLPDDHRTEAHTSERRRSDAPKYHETFPRFKGHGTRQLLAGAVASDWQRPAKAE